MYIYIQTHNFSGLGLGVRVVWKLLIPSVPTGQCVRSSIVITTSRSTNNWKSAYIHIYIYMYVYIYIYTYVSLSLSIYIYIILVCKWGL